MARRPRIFIPGLTHHVIQRGNNRADMFTTTSDYEHYLDALSAAATRHRVQVNGYACMTNHVHLMLTAASDEGIPKTMQSIGRRYVYHFNHRYQRTGGLFDGRYRDLILDTDEYWFTCMRYVELNPVRAGLVSNPHHYRWTSYAAHAFGALDDIITFHTLYLALGPSPELRQEAWRTTCGVALPPGALENIRESVRRGCVSRV
jgi:putative transposase